MNIIEYSNRGSRTVNQDYVIHRSLSADSAIFVLADGMGGYSHGEIASQTVAESIVEYVEQNTTNYTPENLLRESIVFANDALMIKQMEIGGKKMGTVIAVLFIKGTYADHSIVQQLSNKMAITSSIYEKYAAIVTRAIMGDEIKEEIPIEVLSIAEGDTFLLCSDGFHKQLPVEEYAVSCDKVNLKCLDDMAPDMDDNYSFIKVTV